MSGRRCDCGCARHAHGEWISPRLGSWHFAGPCNARLGDALRNAGFNYYAPLDDEPVVVVTGGDHNPRECG